MSRHAHHNRLPYEYAPTPHNMAVRSRLLVIGSIIEYLNQAATLVDPGIDRLHEQPAQGQRLPLYTVETEPFVPVAPTPYQPVAPSPQPELSLLAVRDEVAAAHAAITDPGRISSEAGGTVIEAPFGQQPEQPYVEPIDGVAA